MEIVQNLPPGPWSARALALLSRAICREEQAGSQIEWSVYELSRVLNGPALPAPAPPRPRAPRAGRRSDAAASDGRDTHWNRPGARLHRHCRRPARGHGIERARSRPLAAAPGACDRPRPGPATRDRRLSIAGYRIIPSAPPRCSRWSRPWSCWARCRRRARSPATGAVASNTVWPKKSVTYPMGASLATVGPRASPAGRRCRAARWSTVDTLVDPDGLAHVGPACPAASSGSASRDSDAVAPARPRLPARPCRRGRPRR